MSSLEHLGYKHARWQNNFYTAQPRDGIGVCVAYMNAGAFVQFFPWNENSIDGHGMYAHFVQAKSTSELAENQLLFERWPHFHVEQASDLLLIKCAIENGLSQLEKFNADD